MDFKTFLVFNFSIKLYSKSLLIPNNNNNNNDKNNNSYNNNINKKNKIKTENTSKNVREHSNLHCLRNLNGLNCKTKIL